MEKPIALIVEDDRDIVALFRHVLDVAGYQTEIVLNGREAMERIEAKPPNIVLLDLQLPEMSGLDILKRMRASDRLKSIPVVVITAYPPYADSLSEEPDLLLIKPVDINQLSNLVQRLQATQGAMNEPSYDDETGLYSFSFFMVRLAFSLERIKQSPYRKFGVLFGELPKISELKKKLEKKEQSAFFRKMAEQFRLTLRPTDTVAWSPKDGTLLTLIEDIPTPEAPLKIVGRVRDGMKRFFENHDQGIDLRMNLGVLLCDDEYADVQKIIKDIERARAQLQAGLYTNPAIFDREMLTRH
ncbi:MAG TPA: response regulator [Anaerolineales bacterium]|nr:response regulator [Anaerolineales bacterium]